MTLELFTATGALIGGSVAFLLDDRLLAFLFAILLLYVAATMLRAGTPEPVLDTEPDPSDSVDPDPDPGGPPAPAPPDAKPTLLDGLSGKGYQVRNLGRGVVIATGAGVASALLGIGGGIIKVPLMNLAMGVPLRVATATSNMMIGITAAASAVIYAIHGGLDVYVAGPTAIGVFIGATAGSRLGHRVDLRYLRLLFVIVLVYTAIEMLLRVVG
jgi:uncharacterized membrane protein YfcA